MRIEKIMTKPAITIEFNKTVIDAAKLMLEKNIGFLPVTRNEFLIGVITDRDLVIRALAFNKFDYLVNQAMTSDPIFVLEEDDIKDVAFKMAQTKIRRMVVTKNGRPIGVVTTKNMLQDKEVLHYIIQTYKDDNTNVAYRLFNNYNPHDSVKIDDYPL